MTRVRVPGAARYFFSQSQIPVQTLLRCSYSPRVQSHASTSAGIVKNPKLWQPSVPLFEQTKILHTPVGTGGAALAAAVPYRVERPELSASDNDVL